MGFILGICVSGDFGLVTGLWSHYLMPAGHSLLVYLCEMLRADDASWVSQRWGKCGLTSLLNLLKATRFKDQWTEHFKNILRVLSVEKVHATL